MATTGSKILGNESIQTSVGRAHVRASKVCGALKESTHVDIALRVHRYGVGYLVARTTKLTGPHMASSIVELGNEHVAPTSGYEVRSAHVDVAIEVADCIDVPRAIDRQSVAPVGVRVADALNPLVRAAKVVLGNYDVLTACSRYITLTKVRRAREVSAEEHVAGSVRGDTKPTISLCCRRC